MDLDLAVHRAQVYRFLAEAFLYPDTNWLEELPLAARIASASGLTTGSFMNFEVQDFPLERLQSAHLQTFGLTGSLCYETEIGLPHEFRQSQELADISGFYQAFGFRIGGAVRERPDYLATELEFMYLLAIKEAQAIANGNETQVEICLNAQRQFLEDHLGKWAGLFAEALARMSPRGPGEVGEAGPYVALAGFCAAFVTADAERLGVSCLEKQASNLVPTPFNPDFSCAGCPAAENVGGVE
jgi:nitrate reductase assembly molybdenum cofactor insertion protein NarJ